MKSKVMLSVLLLTCMALNVNLAWGAEETPSQTLTYDTWTYSGSTTNKSSYRLFHSGSYIESAEFDLSTLSKVVVYGGTYGGDTYNKLTIGDGTNTWKSVTVSGSSQTGKNTYTDGTTLSGTGKLRITSNSGKASSNGVRISKVEIYTTGGVTYTDYLTECSDVPTYTVTWSVNGTTTQKEYEAGDALTLPEGLAPTTSDCDSRKQFVGWTNQEINDGNKPAVLFTTPNGTITSDSTFYAVFATASGNEDRHEIVLNANNIQSMGGGSGYQSADFTYSDITFGRSEAYINGGGIQIKAGQNNCVYNKTALSGSITAITITPKTNSCILTVGTSQKPTDNSQTVSSKTTYNFDPTNGYRYFSISATSSYYCVVGEIAITYTATSYSDYVTTCCKPLETPTGMRNTQTHDGGVISWNAVANASGYEVKIDDGEWTNIGSSTSYTITGKEAGGTLVTWQVRAVGTAPYCDMSDPCEVQTFTTNCTQYTFAYGSEANDDDKNINDAVYECFTQVSDGTEWEIRDFVIPNTAQYYWVGYNGYFYGSNIGPGGSNNAGSQRNQFKSLPVTNLQRSGCIGMGDGYNHAMAGAYGRLRIYSNYSDKNLYVAFEPAGYQLRVGEGEAWETWALHQSATASTVWTSDTLTIDETLKAKRIYVNVWETVAFDANKAGVAINNWTNGDGQIQSLSSKKNDQWQFNSGVSTGATGFFRMYSDNCNNNGNLHFVPLHRITYMANYPEGVSGEPADTYSAYVSVEESKSFTNPDAPATPSGYRFAGWYTEATGGTKIETEYTIPVGATADVTLYAKWALNTYTVNWYADGKIVQSVNYNHGTDLALPTSTSSGCGEKVFVGWTANSAYDDATTAPSDLFTEAKGTVTANANYYAVFAKESSSGAVSVGATLWSEDFGNYNTSDVPTGGTYSYSCQGTGTKVYNENLAGGTSPELLVAKNGGSFDVVIPTQGATEATLTYHSNKTSLPVTSDSEGVTLTKVSKTSPFSYKITIPLSATNIKLTFKTSGSDNARLDDISLVVIGTSAYSEYTTSCSGRVSTPVFRPASGATIQSGEKVAITCSTEGAAIHYTLDGSEPTAESDLYAEGGVRISVQEADSVTLKAIAIADGMGNSYVAIATYSVTLPAPTGVILHANNGTDDYAAVSVAYGSSEPVCYFPTYAGSIFLGFYTSATKGEGLQLYDASEGTMVLNVEGYTDADGWASLDSRIDLYAQWKKPEDIVVDENTTNLDIYPYDLSTTDIIITSTGTLTITKNERVHDVHVQSGGSLIINGGTLDVNSLHLYSGWQGDKTAYGVASVYIAPEASLSKTVQTVYLDLCIDNDHFYPLAVPFPVKICGTSESEANMQGYHVRYAEDWLNQYAKYRADGTGQVIIKRYDGAHRSETGKAEGNWVGVAYNETLQPSEGYIIRAVPVSGQDTAVIRIEMEVPDAWTTSGEQGTVENITRNQISVTAHGTDKPTLDDTHKGWNMLGVPYLSYFGTQNWDGESSSIAGGKVVIQDGKIVLDDKTVRYVSVPTYDFSEYIQTRLSSTSLRPGWSFFVQIGKGGTLTFATTDREASSPLLAPAQSHSEQELTLLLSHGAKSDHTGLILSDAYTTDYEIGADLEKMFGEGFTLSVYTLSGNTRLAYNALSREAATQLIPVGFRAPEDGEYTFSLPDDSPTEGIERIDLIDYETGTLTNLLSAPYTFSTTRTESDSRFAITITYSKETPTDTEAPFGKGNKRIEKVLIQQQLYIIIDGKMYDATGKKVNE
ncbi:MAG: InlB B-repeat-containing protein [Bacteroidales bacterium]|nr:InlB B-repeat-containing protein [Bacteroidales bacterium]